MTKKTTKSTTKPVTKTKKNPDKPAKAESEKTLSSAKKESKTNIALKLSVVFAGIAMLANILIYFFAILPTYEVIDSASSGSLGETLDRSENVTNILTPVVYVALGISVAFLIIGIIKYVRNKPKTKSRNDSSKNS